MKTVIDYSQDNKLEYQKNAIGYLFIEARSQKNLSLDEVSSVLKIRKIFLEAIENDNLDVLPGGVYTVGFIKNYARYIDVDIDIVLQKLNHFNGEDTHKNNICKNTVSFSQVKPVNKYYVLTSASLLILVAIFSYLYWSKTDNISKVEQDSIDMNQFLLSKPTVNDLQEPLTIKNNAEL